MPCLSLSTDIHECTECEWVCAWSVGHECVNVLGGCVCVPQVCINVSTSSQHVMSMHEEHVHLEGTRPCCPAASPGGGAFLWLLFHLSCSVFEEKGEPSLHGDFWAAHGTETGHAQ